MRFGRGVRSSACATAGAPPSAVSAPVVAETGPAGYSPRDVIDGLEPRNSDTRLMAVNAVLVRPEAFTPPAFAWVARELIARGRRDEAILWAEFGGRRLSIDFAAALDAESNRTVASTFARRYAQDVGDDYLDHYLSLPALRDTIDTIVAMQAVGAVGSDRK